MTLYEKVLEQIDKNHQRHLSGELNAIPFGFERFDTVFPGIMKGIVYATTAATGVGKSQLAKNLFVQRPYKFIKENPDKNIKLKVFWFGLEESKEEFCLSMISNKLYHDTGQLIDSLDLMTYKNKELPQDVRDLLHTDEYINYYKEFEKCIEIIDHEYNPYGIYKKLREYATANGKFFVDGVEVKPIVESNKTYYEAEDGTKYKYFTDYEPNDSNEFVVCVVDHVSIIESEKDDKNLHDSMSKLVSKYLRKVCAKKFGYIPVIIHQQKMDGDNENKFKGVKVTPAISKLGDNLVISRD